MNIKEIEELELKSDRVRDDYKFRVSLLERFATACSYVCPKPKGWIFKRCPMCQKKLMLTKYSLNPKFMTATQYWEYICECGYHYVKERYFGD